MKEPRVCVFFEGGCLWGVKEVKPVHYCSSLWAFQLEAAASVQHFISSLIRTRSLQSVERGCHLCCKGVIRHRSRKQNSFVSHCISLPGRFLYHNVTVLENSVWLYLSVCFCMLVCLCDEGSLEFLFGRTGRKTQRDKLQEAQSDRNSILLGEKVIVTRAWCKFTDWILFCVLFLFFF